MNGFESIEIACWPPSSGDARRYAGTSHIDVTTLTKDRADDIAGRMTERGLVISGLGYYPNPLNPDPAHRDMVIGHLRHVITAAELMGVPLVNTFMGADKAKTQDENWDEALRVWPDIVAFADDHGRKITIENCPMLFSGDEWPGGKNLAYAPAIWRRMFEEIPSQSFGLNFDPSHCVWLQMDYLAPLREFAPRLFHVHAKDVRLDRDRLNDVGILATPLEYHTPKLPGLGDIDWGRFFSVLSDAGYRGPVCVEVEDRAYEGSLESRKRSLIQSARYLRQFM